MIAGVGIGPLPRGGETLDQQSIDYYRSRERTERAAAANAECEQARRVHLELARGYAALIRQGEREQAIEPPLRLVG